MKETIRARFPTECGCTFRAGQTRPIGCRAVIDDTRDRFGQRSGITRWHEHGRISQHLG